jgi:coenzyme F420-dependent glucose-6-phosphate dehydrogenase
LTLSGEEQGPRALVSLAVAAEEAGFDFLMLSDHFHPWIDRQGQSPFAWSVLGGIASLTRRIHVGTGVTCPLIRLHPALVAQAAATVAEMMPGRFALGLGTGENLNEHVVGTRWPPAAERQDMLEEAVSLIRELFGGENVNHRGRYYTVENARLYTVPEEPPPIRLAAAGPQAAELAGKIGDGLIATSPDRETVARFEKTGGSGKPRYGQVTVCWASDEAEARRTAHEWWPNAAIPGELGQELPLPRHFEQAASVLTEDQVAELVVCGPDPDRLVETVDAYVRVGFDHVYLHQVGPDQGGFLRFFQRELAPRLARSEAGFARYGAA